MTEEYLKKYIRQFEKLRRDYRNGGAPHKPILLLSILTGIRTGWIESNHIPINAELVAKFKDLWAILVRTNHRKNFALPFYHMKSEPFWTLKALPGHEFAVTSSNSIRSFKNLRENLDHAIVDPDLFHLMQDTEGNAVLSKHLLDTYFEGFELRDGDGEYLVTIESDIAAESKVDYERKLKELKESMTEEEFEEEVFVRGSMFKKKIPQIYDYTCAISGLRIDAVSDASLLDACHIVPFSETQNDTLRNGILLCPNLHRAFDRGLISIDDDYRVIVRNSFRETESPYSIRQFEGNEINLPRPPSYAPDPLNLDWHRRRWEF